MDAKNTRPRSNLQFVKPQVSCSSSSLTRKNEALAKITEECDKLKEEIKLLKMKAAKCTVNDAFTQTDSTTCINACVGPDAFTELNETDDVTTQTDYMYTQNDCVQTQTDLVYKQTDYAQASDCIQKFDCVQPSVQTYRMHVNSTTDTDTVAMSEAELMDMANSKSIHTFNFQNLSIPELMLLHLKLNDKVVFLESKNKFSKYRAKTMQETVREICHHLISDELLKKFSYQGRKGKLRFKDYDNITKLIAEACSDSMLQNHHPSVTGKKKIQMSLAYEREAEEYFVTQHMKHAKQRFENQK